MGFCLKKCSNMDFVGVDMMGIGGFEHAVGAVVVGPAVELCVELIILECNLEFDLLSFFQLMNH